MFDDNSGKQVSEKSGRDVVNPTTQFDEDIFQLPADGSLPLLEPVSPGRTSSTAKKVAVGVAVVFSLSALVAGAVAGFHSYAERGLSALSTNQDQEIKVLRQQIDALMESKRPAAKQQAAALAAEIEALRRKTEVASTVPAKSERVSADSSTDEPEPQKRRRRAKRPRDSSAHRETKMEISSRDRELERVAVAMSKPTETNVDGLSGASISWTPQADPPEKVAAEEPAIEQDELDRLVGSALNKPQNSASERKRAEGTAQNSLQSTQSGGLPERPSRAQIKRAMSAVAPAVKQCGSGDRGRVHIKLAVSGATGRVIDAHPAESGDFAGTPVGLCAARKARLARLPKFAVSRMVIKYPFDL